ncbi:MULTISPECIES: hypothetical protein [Streptomyces]|uniref:hypothetical protein n=1 Tax=Streptomyces TaxID=1883 RepID=UPI0006E15A5F|nr:MULTISPECIES: hypothetical protein [Streptomyces]MCL6734404.1 hypothetical protein [Streptomyces neyagawaensis]MDE1682033.1 hypothetical protein [Streptomyces neyagawaensis]
MTDQPSPDTELRHQLDDVIKSLGAAETELAALRRRNRLAHKARRAAEHKLDGIRRALCDIGAMQDDDPYSHADLEDVIRQAGRLDELSAAVAADLDAEADRADAYQPDPPIDCLTPNLPPDFGTVTPCVAPDPLPAPASLREQLAAPIDRILGDWPEHNRTDEHEAVRNELLEAVLAVVPAVTRIAAGRARDAEAEVQRVVDLYERWVKAGPPPLGAPLARWWDQRLVELRKAILGTKDPS